MLCPCPRVANACTHVCVSYDLVVSSPFVYWLGIATGTCVFYDIHAHTRWEVIMAHTFTDICAYLLKQLFFFLLLYAGWARVLSIAGGLGSPLELSETVTVYSDFLEGTYHTHTSVTDSAAYVTHISRWSNTSGLWILMANCLAEGSFLKSLWWDGFEKLFLLRNVTDLYIYI